MADDQSEEPKEDKLGENEEQPKKIAAEERAEYFKKLEKWLYEAYAWQRIAAMFPYYPANGQTSSSTSGATLVQPQTQNTSNTHWLILDANGQQNDPLRQRRVQEPVGPPFQQVGAEGGYEYRIPPTWKRFAAAFIDTILLSLPYYFIILIAIDVFDFISSDDLELLRTNLRMDYNTAFKMMYSIVTLDIIYTVIACAFEVFWLQHGVNGRIGGATPGKSMMGLRVVQCRSVTPVDRPEDPDVVLVTPGTNLGLPLAICRSIVKHIIMSILFPGCFIAFFSRYNRSSYDILCNSIVVEDPYRNLNNNRLHQQ